MSLPHQLNPYQHLKHATLNGPIILESPSPVKSLTEGPHAGTIFDSMLKEYIDRFLIEVKESCEFFTFRSILFRLIQASVDPPLEVIWFYSALGFHEAIRSKKDVLDRIFAVRDLLQLLSACSYSCNDPKGVALLAPVVSELYHFLSEAKKLSGEVAKKLRKEIESLVEAAISYVSICSGRNNNGRELSDGYLVPAALFYGYSSGVDGAALYHFETATEATDAHLYPLGKYASQRQSNGDFNKAISYSKLFRTSSVPNALVKWSLIRFSWKNITNPMLTRCRSFSSGLWLLKNESLSFLRMAFWI
ncbi:hypothetical protein ZIOFF_047114 [Zingiber officinale]|uniref:Uncharacterized protein n=1 Tax=Zingiber officinale TaxID=94328 RepID=A0A8J5FQC2_ZINOF|nr:hypothetical protein ZIOFF_047114 [Zingiber officinale]